MPNPQLPQISIRLGTSDILSVHQVWHMNEYKPIVDKMKQHGVTEPTIIDAGAYIGAASLYFLKEWDLSKVLAIEPDSDNWLQVARNVGLKAMVKPWALSTSIGRGSMKSPDNDPSFWGKQLHEDPTGLVSTIDFSYLLGFLKEIEWLNALKVDLLKMDIEGTERALFNDPIQADIILGNIRYLAMEIHERQFPGTRNIVIEALERHNFFHWTKGETLFAYDKSLEK